MKKGFTLIELLAVIVILAIIALIAVPIVLNIINDAKKSSQEESFNLYANAVENAVASYLMKNPSTDPTTLRLNDIKDYIKYSGEKIECETLQIGEKGEIYLADCTVGGIKTEYKYGEMLYPKPELTQGLTPVIYDGDNWKIVDKNDKDWYDYDEQKWANAVVLKSGSTKTIGDTVTVEGNNPDVLMMYVWIPRYEYKIEGQYGTHQDRTEGTQELPGEIKVNFISKNTTMPTEGYHINSAFTFDGKKSGFWVGKFELSHTELSSSTTENNLGCTNSENGVTCTADSTKFRILPNASSLRYNNVSNFWYGIKSIENPSSFGITNIDIHMMKNSEWGAVAYLSQSKYGKYGNPDYEGIYKEVYQNKDTENVTGKSNGTPSQNDYRSEGQCAYNDMTNLGEDSNGYKMGQCGTGASTTGNIYGVYDMSGGAREYVMGAYGTEADGIYSGNSTSYNSGFNGKTGSDSGMITNGVSLPETKYYDVYLNLTNSSSNNGNQSCKNGTEYGVCYGHAISETSDWYNDYAYMVYANMPWFVRGGNYNSYINAGVFYRSCSDIGSFYSYSSRVVGIIK